MSKFSLEQLNYFKFASVVLGEFPTALRKVFVHLWDTKVAPTPSSFKAWDDSLLVRNMFLSKEGGKTKSVPTKKSYKEWDCTALFEATLYAQSFAVSVPGGKGKTLADLYVKPYRLPRGAFHSSVTSPSGDNDETFALALDQLRLLRNSLCHNSNSEIVKKTFDHYIQLSKDAFAALGQSSTRIDDIGKLAEGDFPTARVQQLELELRQEKLRAIEDGIYHIEDQVKDVASGVTNVSSEVEDVKKEVNDVGSQVKDVKTEVLYTRTKVEKVQSDVKNVKTGMEDVRTTVEDVGAHVKDVKTGLEDVTTSVKDVGSNVNEVKAGLINVNKNMDVFVTEVQTVLTDVRTEMDELKASVEDNKQANEAVSSKGHVVPGHTVPDKIPQFYGRKKECEAILGHLTSSKSTRLVDIWGSPGFGKTSMAITVAHQLLENKIPVYFVSLRGMKSKDELVSKLLSIFADVKQVPHISPSHWLIQRLQQLQNPFVLILDNADDLLESGDTTVKEEVLRLSKDILVQCCHIKLLFTTRGSLDYLKLEVPIHLEKVGILDEISSAKLVKSLLPSVSENNCSSIIKECGQVPLAIRLMCSIMREENVPLNELLEELKTSTLVEVLDDDRLPHCSRLKSLINTSFQRLSPKEREAFVSLAVFPGNFEAKEARAVMGLEKAPELTSKKILRALEAKSLIESRENFCSFTIHSLLRSFIDDNKFCDGATKTTFDRAQLRFYGYYISSFEDANKMFFTGHSNDAVEKFVSRRENIIKSLANGTRKDELYAKTTEVLSKAELFLFSVLHDEQLTFNRLYDNAVEKARRKKQCDIERKLLAAKSFGCLGFFFSNEQNLDSPLQHSFIDAADCPPKLLCYGGIYQLLCGKPEEGILLLKRSVDRLNNDYGEKVFMILAYHVLAVCHRNRQNDEIASYTCSIESESGSLSPAFCSLFSRDTLSSRESNVRCLPESVAERDAFFFALTAELLPSLYKSLGDQFEMELSVITSSLLRLQKVLLVMFQEGRVLARMLETCCKGLERLDCNKEAEEGFELIARQLEDVLGVHKDTARNYHSLGEAQKNFKEYEAAHCSFNKALEMRTSILRETTETAHDSSIIKGTIESLISLTQVCENINGTTADVDNFVTTCEELERILVKSKDEHFAQVCFVRLGRVLNNFGELYLRRKDYGRALMLLQWAIRIKEENLGDSVETVPSLNNEGAIYLEMKRYKEAENSFHRALDLSLRLREKHMGSHKLTATSFHQIGITYHKMSRYEEAVKQFQKAVELRTELLGDHTETALSLKCLSDSQHASGDVTKAVATLQRLVCTYKALDDHENTARGYYKIGELRREMGDLSGALTAVQMALRLRNELSWIHPDTASYIHFLGVINFEMGDLKAAAEELQRAASMRRELLGEHEATASCYHCLGVAQSYMGDYDEALISLQKALDMRRKLLGAHAETARTFNSLGNLHSTMGAVNLAFEALQNAAYMRTHMLGDHEDTATSYLRLGEVQLKIGDLKGAFESVHKSMQLRQKLLGDHPDTAESTHVLGCVYLAMDDNKLALEEFQTALNMRSKLLGKHKDTAYSNFYLSGVQTQMGDLKEAVESLQKSLQLYQELLGNHTHTATNFFSLGLAYFTLGDTSSALTSLQKAADMSSQLLGCHENTVCSYQWLAEVQDSVGDHNGAIESWKKAFEFAGV